jgi:hypothetical protein
MALFSALGRFAKLGFWVALSAGAMLADACTSDPKGKARDGSSEVPGADAPGLQSKLDGPIKADTGSPGMDGGAVDADNPTADASQTDLWDIICE